VAEIERISKNYFIQTPHKLFPIESHTQFPFIGFLNRPFQMHMINMLNSFWIKKTQPDWYLLNKNQLQHLFPKAEIFVEKYFGFPKSLIALKYESKH